MNLRMYWCLSPNFGDAMTPYFAEKLGINPVYVTENDRQKVLFSGSVLNHAKPGDLVWGSGIANEYDVVMKDLDIRAVRGPLLAKKLAQLGYPETIIGDAGLAMAYVYSPKPLETRVRVAVVPHYVDYARLLKLFDGAPSVRVVNVLRPVEEVVDAICSADRVLSSSLHGLVTAAAYDIPFAWLRGSSAIYGDGFKYRDFLEACRCKVYSVNESAVLDEEAYQKASLICSVSDVWLACPLHSESALSGYRT